MEYKGKIKAVSKYGSLLFENNDSWFNNKNREVSDEEKQELKKLIGKVIKIDYDDKYIFSNLKIIDVQEWTTKEIKINDKLVIRILTKD